jgi:hypothetical protein
MSDELPFYAPNKPPRPARQPQPGEHLWTLTRGDQSRRAELRDAGGAAGAELQVFVNGEFASGRRYAARELALADAVGLRATLELDGWTCSRCRGEWWVCETHRHRPAHHDDQCAGAGEPCPDCNRDDPPRPPRDFVSLVR